MGTASLVSVIRSSIAAQNRETALVSCHRGWDGTITQDTVLQGVMERFTAIGKGDQIAGGMTFQRKGLSHVNLVRKDSQGRENIVLTNMFGDSEAYCRDTFHSHEVKEIGAWMQEHVYH